MRQFYNHYKRQIDSYFSTVQSYTYFLVFFIFIIKGIIDLFQKGHYYLLKYLQAAATSFLSGLAFFGIILAIECLYERHRRKKYQK